MLTYSSLSAQQYKPHHMHGSKQGTSLSENKQHKATKNKLQTDIFLLYIFVDFFFISKVIKHSMTNGEAKTVK